MTLVKSSTLNPDVFCFFNLDKIKKVIARKDYCEIFTDEGLIELKDIEANSFINELKKIHKNQHMLQVNYHHE